MAGINRGAYSQECPYEVDQLRYAGGGHPGCGGYLEVLRLKAEGVDRWFLQQYVDDIEGQRYRFIELKNEAEAIESFELKWPESVALRMAIKWPIPVWDYLAAKSGSLTVMTAAIKDSRGKVHTLPRPARHNDVIRHMRELGIEEVIPQGRQGFVLSNGMFAMRKPSLGVAVRAKQIKRGDCHNPGVGLFSEDLW